MPQGRILYLDAYDSFSNNIVALLEDNLPATVEAIKIDDRRFVLNDDAFQDFLNKFDAVVAGPGPGHPENPDDIGLIGKLWHLPAESTIPTLGICLGFQSLALAFGASVERLREPRHGLVTTVTHCHRDLFQRVEELKATQYHSLHVCVDSNETRNEGKDTLWMPSGGLSDLLPLAWDLGDRKNGQILMGLRHATKPFWGVQFHPESICSMMGKRLVKNWWQEISCLKAHHSCMLPGSPKDSGRASIEADWNQNMAGSPRTVSWKAVNIPATTTPSEITGALRYEEDFQPILLESGVRESKPVNPETGRFSIIGLHSAASLQVRWSLGQKDLLITTNQEPIEVRAATVDQVFEALDDITAQYKAQNGQPNVPFWGGLVGFISYETGLETISVETATHQRPDIWFVLIERSIVIDHQTETAFVQSIREDDGEWVFRTVLKLLASLPSQTKGAETQKCGNEAGILISEPESTDYCKKVNQCQDHLRAGSSYELCLTDQTLVRNGTPAWSLYQDLRSINPAPFGAYVRLQCKDGVGLTVLSSSPERFLSWSRRGICQFRPIKGTVKKGPKMTRAKAEMLLESEKERAENLMIVDLIRHDLYGVEGVQNVHVPRLMTVEEYETVYQLVSVIEGDLSTAKSRIAALRQSLPPGSMTGAPKKRSCELLQELECHKPRSLYSGVIGYLDVGGGADFSVVIRTAFNWDDEGDVWRIGAGGAITALSDPEAEWQEMLAKRESVLNVLGP